MNNELDHIKINSKSKKELADQYKVSLKTFNSWSKIAGFYNPKERILTPKKVKMVYLEFGYPE